MLKLKYFACTTLASLFVLFAAAGASACPAVNYQPELPRRD